MSEYRRLINIGDLDKHADWDMLEKLYCDNFENYSGAKENTIPKTIHQIWLGSKIPDKYKKLSDTWIEKNPTWNYVLWGDDNIDSLNLINRKLFDSAKNYGVKSDILRYEILYNYGGIYIDTDFECIKPFDDLMYLDFFTGSGFMKYPELLNGLMASKPKHEILSRLINGIKNKENANTNVGFDDLMKITGPYYFSEIMFKYLRENIQGEKIVVFPRMFFYSVPSTVRFNIRNLTVEDRKSTYKYIDDVYSYCIHFFCTSWQI